VECTHGRVLYLDPFSGIAGDMFLGLLLDLGLDDEALVAELERLGVRFDLAVSQVTKNGIAAISTKITLPSGPDSDEDEHVHYDDCCCDNCSCDEGHDPGHVHQHGHSHDHEHPEVDDASSEEDDEESQLHGHGMALDEILAILDRASEPTRSKAKDMFLALIEAEAQVHGTTVDSVHLHEAGAIDAVVEIVGAVKGLELLGVQHVTCGLVNTGTGFAKMAHGTYPVPAPATAELLKGIPIHMNSFTETRKELVTPTGALILSHLVDDFAPISMTVERVGYGAGRRNTIVPNVLRGFLGYSASAEAPRRLVLLESNIDDMNPELFGNLLDVLYQNGALDVFFTSIQMKKNRPGTRVSVLGELHFKDVLVQTLMKESTTLGVRATYPERYEAERRFVDVETRFGPARIKVGTYRGETVTISPEYESCRQLSAQSGVPLKEVYTVALEAARTHSEMPQENR